ncbi:MAG: CapA family protein [Carboxylicivirga sp.]|nr:CapA family protein [Carboxylicivirga sp.]
MKIGFIGDTIISNNLTVDDRLRDLLLQNDFNIANLEAPFIKESYRATKGMGLHQLSDSCQILHDLNIKGVSLANNHLMDFGEEGLINTLEVLKRNQIGYFGAGRNRAESLQPLCIEHKNKSYRFYGGMQDYFQKKHFAGKKKAGAAPWPLKNYETTPEDSHNFLFLHWNQEFELLPEPASKYYAEQLGDCYQLIIGSHAHCYQGAQIKGQTPIVYSLGNFSLPHQQYYNTFLKPYPAHCYTGLIYIWNSKSEDELIYCQIDKNGEAVSFLKKERISDFIQTNKAICEPLKVSYKDYRRHYQQNRKYSKRPVLSTNKLVNQLIFKGYIRGLLLFQKIEIFIAAVLDTFGVRKIFKQLLSKFIKHYQ